LAERWAWPRRHVKNNPSPNPKPNPNVGSEVKVRASQTVEVDTQ